MAKAVKKLQVVVLNWEDHDGYRSQKLFLQGTERAFVFKGEPEDMCIGRDLVDCVDIARLIQEAVKYDEVEYIYKEISDDPDNLPEEELMALTAEFNWGC